MKHIFLILGVLLSVSQIFGQKPINSLRLNIKGEAQAYQFTDQKQSLNYLLVNDRVNASVYKLNAKMQVEDSIHQAKLDSKYNKFTGSIIENDQPVLFWSTKNSSAIISQKFDFKDRKYYTHEFDLNLKKEKVLCQFTALNQFYIFTLIDDSSLIKAYKFTDSKTVTPQLINLSTYRFFDRDYQQQNLDQVLKYSFALEKAGYEPFELEQIDLSSPNPISLTSNKKKFYIENNILTITLDHNANYTDLIRIDLTNNSTEQLHITKPLIKSESIFELNSNSFLHQNHLVQLKTSTKKLFLTIKDLKGDVIAEYSSNNNEEMSFINGKPTVQKNNKTGSIKNIERTAAFLRQIKYNKMAVTCYPEQDGYNIIFGAIEPRTNDVDIALAGSFGLTGSFLYLAFNSMSTNPMAKKLQAFSEARSISATVLTDKDFKAIPGTIKSTVYQNIYAFLSTKEIKSKAETLFQFQQKTYLGYYDTKINQYNFFEFE